MHIFTACQLNLKSDSLQALSAGIHGTLGKNRLTCVLIKLLSRVNKYCQRSPISKWLNGDLYSSPHLHIAGDQTRSILVISSCHVHIDFTKPCSHASVGECNCSTWDQQGPVGRAIPVHYATLPEPRAYTERSEETDILLLWGLHCSKYSCYIVTADWVVATELSDGFSYCTGLYVPP